MATQPTTTVTSTISIGKKDSGHEVSPTLFGLFLEDINFSVDGGLNANLVGNHCFDGIYLDPKGSNLFSTILLHRRATRRQEPLRGWNHNRCDLETLTHGDPRRGNFLRVQARDGATLTNHGPLDSKPSIGARAGIALNFDVAVRSDNSDPLSVALVGSSGRVLAEATTTTPTSEWSRVTAALIPEKNETVSLRITLPSGRTDIDDVRLIAADSWGINDPKWSQGLLRRDLVESIRDINPTFLRFPGGCVVEGLDLTNAYNWKNTVGPLETRVGDYNLWGLNRADRGYAQSHQMGFYEMFLLCEDLGMAPLPVVNAGISCQLRRGDRCAVGSAQWKDVVQDVIDLIDWATGDPETNSWAALRADAGHPEPFPLDMIGIGNENFGEDYLERFDLIAEAIDRHRPGMRFVISAGPYPAGKSFDMTWKHARSYGDRIFVDEHFYKTPKWFESAATRYDDYPRAGAQVFAGEYAARVPLDFAPRALRPAPNTWHSALAEAAFYTGLIRNSDVVTLSSYAPLLSRVAESQWGHNLINFNAFTLQPTLNYHVQALFTSGLGSRTLAVSSGDSAVFTSATLDELTINVHLVNTTAQRQTVVLTLPADIPVDSELVSQRLEGQLNDVLRLDPGTTNSPVLTPITASIQHDSGRVTIELPPYSVTKIVATRATSSSSSSSKKASEATND